MFSSFLRSYLVVIVAGAITSSTVMAQGGAAAPGGATSSVAPGGVVSSAAPSGVAPSVAPGGAIPSVAPGTPLPQAAPGTLPPQAAPGTLPPQAAPGNAPAFVPNSAQPRPGTVGGATSSGSAAAGTTTSATGVSTNATGATSFNGTPTTLGLGFTADGNGLRLNGVVGGSLAQRAGLLANDQVVGVNGQTVHSQAELQSAMRKAFDANASLNLFVRRNGQLQSIAVPLPSMTASPTGNSSAAGSTGIFRGFTDGIRFSTGVANGGITSAGGTDGLQVSQVTPNSWAAEAGVQVNDRVVSVDGQSVNSDLRLSSLLHSALRDGTSAQLMVNRNGVLTPLTVNRPAGFLGTTFPQVSGDFSTDFGRFAGDFSQAIQQAQQNSINQFQQLNQFNDRVSTLRGLIMSSTGQSADNVRILEQLRSLRSDLTAFNAQTSGVMQPQIQEFLMRLNQLNPSFAEATATVPNAAAPAAATNVGSSTNPIGPAGAAGTRNNAANTPSAGPTNAAVPRTSSPR